MTLRVCALLLVLAASVGAQSQDWPEYGGTSQAWRFSGLDQVNASNVHKLTPAWIFQTGDQSDALESTPIVLDGVVYLSTSSNWVVALDGATGKLIWEYRYPTPRQVARYGRQNRGVAVADGRVFLGTADNHLVALDQRTGAELWDVDVEDAGYCGCNITGAPLVVKGKVITGVTGGDSAHRGYLTAFDVRSGRLAWRFYTIPKPGEKGSETWPGESWRFGGGATWLTGTYDAELNLLYWGVGNPAADFDASTRRGDNLYTGSVIALDPDTGKLVWHRQLIPQDAWDYDTTYELTLLDAIIQGRRRKVLVQFGKSGYAFVLDRVNGQHLNAWPFVKHITWTTGIAADGSIQGRNEPKAGKATLICPGAIGGRSWNHSAFSPKTGFIYSTGMEICSDITAETQTVDPGASWFGGRFVMKPPPGDRPRGYIAAYDPVTGRRAWTHDYRYFLLGSLLATAGDLVFAGDPEGNFFALNAANGKRLWSFPTGAGHRGSPVSYAAGGRQFIATPTGWGSIIGRIFPSLWPDAPQPRLGSALVVFALPEESRSTSGGQP